MRRHREPWTKAERQTALRLTNGGKSDAEIAKELGRTESGVRNYLYALRIGAEKLAQYRATRTPRPKLGPSPATVSLEVVLNRPTPEMLRDREVRAMLPHRDLTGAFFNDPPVGLSALEGRR